MWFKRECRRIEKSLWTLSEQPNAREDAADTTSARLGAHLRRCAACRAQWEAYRQTRHGLDMLRARPLPASQTHWQEVQARITVVPDGLPAPSSASAGWSLSGSTAIFHRRIGLIGATAILVCCCVLAGTKRPVDEATPFSWGGKYASAVPGYKSRPQPSFAQLSDATFFGAIPGVFKTGLSPGQAADRIGDQSRANSRAADRPRRSLARRLAARSANAGARRRHERMLAASDRRMRIGQTSSADGDNQEPILALALTETALSLRRAEPEYVLTTAEDADAMPRRYIMDSINVDAQSAPSVNVDGMAVRPALDMLNHSLDSSLNSGLSNSTNILNDILNNIPNNKATAQAAKETRAW